MTENDIIKGCLRNDAACQRQIFNRYAGKMLAVCHRYAHSQVEAEDILQDAFIKVFKNLDRFRFEGSFEGWIRRIVVNTALKTFRQKHVKYEDVGLEAIPEVPLEPTAISNLGEQEIMAMINELPEGYRIVFNLFAIEGYSHKEISAMLQIQEGTSRSQLAKARRLLQVKLANLNRVAI